MRGMSRRVLVSSVSVTSGGRKSSCPKFLPNIFNQAKCSQCFGTREEHNYVGPSSGSEPVLSPAGSGGHEYYEQQQYFHYTQQQRNDDQHLQHDQYCEKSSSGGAPAAATSAAGQHHPEGAAVEKAGWLFLAPPSYTPTPNSTATGSQLRTCTARVKRWQRRWFMLYSGGYLSYSVDPDPDALPQGSFNLTQSLLVPVDNDNPGDPDPGCFGIESYPPEEMAAGVQEGQEQQQQRVIMTYLKGSTEMEGKAWAKYIAKYTTTHNEHLLPGQLLPRRGDPDGSCSSSSTETQQGKSQLATSEHGASTAVEESSNITNPAGVIFKTTGQRQRSFLGQSTTTNIDSRTTLPQQQQQQRSDQSESSSTSAIRPALRTFSSIIDESNSVINARSRAAAVHQPPLTSRSSSTTTSQTQRQPLEVVEDTISSTRGHSSSSTEKFSHSSTGRGHYQRPSTPENTESSTPALIQKRYDNARPSEIIENKISNSVSQVVHQHSRALLQERSQTPKQEQQDQTRSPKNTPTRGGQYDRNYEDTTTSLPSSKAQPPTPSSRAQRPYDIVDAPASRGQRSYDTVEASSPSRSPRTYDLVDTTTSPTRGQRPNAETPSPHPRGQRPYATTETFASSKGQSSSTTTRGQRAYEPVVEASSPSSKSQRPSSTEPEDEVVDLSLSRRSTGVSSTVPVSPPARAVRPSVLKSRAASTEEADDLPSPASNNTFQMTSNSLFLTEENRLLTVRLNDLTEKLYTSEKNFKLLKSKYIRYKNHSLKEKELSGDIYNKINQLEIKLGISSNPGEVEGQGAGGSSTSEWYRCTNCTQLEAELQVKNEKWAQMEEECKQLSGIVKKYQQGLSKTNMEIQNIKESSAREVSLLDTSYTLLLTNLRSSHELALLDLEMKHEAALAEETRCTLAAIEALKRNHEQELTKEISKFKTNWITSIKKKHEFSWIALEDQDGEEAGTTAQVTSFTEIGNESTSQHPAAFLESLMEELKNLNLKYTQKCSEVVQLEQELLVTNQSK